MSARRYLGAAAGALALVVTGAGSALAATPPSGSLTAPAPGDTPSTTAWAGSVPPGGHPTSECTPAALIDSYALTYTPSTAAGAKTTLTFSITWKPVAASAANDLILTVADSTGKALGSSDTSDPKETVSLDNPAAGTYTALVCGYVNAAPQAYDGTVTATTTAASTVGPPKPVFTTTGPGPNPEVPEVPLPVLLPLLGAGVAGGVLVLRRRRHTA